MTVPYMKMPGSSIVVQAIISAIDDYAERERDRPPRILLGPTAQRGRRIMRRAMMTASVAASCYRFRKGSYRHRTRVRFGCKPVKGRYRRWMRD
jgi:hypothetical protein